MDLRGARFAIGDEIEGNKRLSEKMVKRLIGGDAIRARYPHEKPVTFLPTHNLAIFGNHKPIIRDTDFGIRRRVKLVPFNVNLKEIPVEKRKDRGVFLDYISENELSGILNRLLNGFRDYKIHGLVEPEAVTVATAAYFADQDVLGHCLEECFEEKEYGKIELKKFAETYKAWCEQEGEYCQYPSARKLAPVLRERGMRLEKSTGNKDFVFGYVLTYKNESRHSHYEAEYDREAVF